MIATWYGIAGAMLIIYVVLDGRNFGAGMLHGLVAQTPEERRQVIAAIRGDEPCVGLVDCREDGIARGSDMVAAEIPTQDVVTALVRVPPALVRATHCRRPSEISPNWPLSSIDDKCPCWTAGYACC